MVSVVVVLCGYLMLGFARSRSYTAMSIRTHVVESALLIHPCCSNRSAQLLARARVNSSIHIVRNRSVLCTQGRG